MGAICGVINKKDDEWNIYRKSKMIQYFNNRFENANMWSDDKAYFGASVTNVSIQSKYETVPYVDEYSNYVITADAILDNRQNLLNELNFPREEWKQTPDSIIILEAYKYWGNECAKHLLGDFAFAIYDTEKNSLFCARDQVGKRTLYFYNDNRYFAFSTNMTAILKIMEKKCPLNDRWIADFLSFDGPLHELDANQTVFKDIKQLLPATILYLNEKFMNTEQYWKPCIDKAVHLKSSQEYAVRLKEVFSQAVHARLKTDGNVGILLSGGIDSGSVASIAAMRLAEQDKVLRAYSSVPFGGFQNRINKRRCPDETEYIESLKLKYENIEHLYCPLEEKNPITNMDKYLNLLEHPYKFIENCYWMNELTSLAALDGCRTLLNGQFGNASISYGPMSVHVMTLIRKKKYFTLIRDLKYYCKFMDYRMWSEIKKILKVLLPDSMLRILGHEQTITENAPINDDLAKKWHVDDRLKEYKAGKYVSDKMDIYDMRELFMSPRILSQLGGVDTKFSLEYGIQVRDPSLDLQVVEYCYSVPYHQYVNKGKERELIRIAMEGILPDKIRLNYKVRGIQSVDWVQRLIPYVEEIKKELNRMLKNEMICYYINTEEIRGVLNSIIDTIYDSQVRKFRMLIVTMIFGRFIEEYQKK